MVKNFQRGGGHEPTYTEGMGRKYKPVLDALQRVHELHVPFASATKAMKLAEREIAKAKDDESRAKAEAALEVAKAQKAEAEVPWTEAKLAAKAAVVGQKDLLEGKEQRILLTYIQNGAADFRVRNGEIFTQKIEPGILKALANSMGEGEEAVKDQQVRKADPFYAFRWEASNRFDLTAAGISLAIELGTSFPRGFLNGLEYLVMTALPAAIAKAKADKNHDRLKTLLDYEENLVTGKAATDGQKGKRALVPYEMLVGWRKRAAERQVTKQGEGASHSSASKPGVKPSGPMRTVRMPNGGYFTGTREKFVEVGLGDEWDADVASEAAKAATAETPAPATTDEAVEGAQEAQG